MSNSLYSPNTNWHPAALDAYNERIAILTEGAPDLEPLPLMRRIAWIQAEAEDRIHKKAGHKQPELL